MAGASEIEYPVTNTDLSVIERKRCRLNGVTCTTVCGRVDVLVVVDPADPGVAPQPARSPAAMSTGKPGRTLFTT